MSAKYPNGLVFLEALISNENAVRNEAEKYLVEIKKSSPETLITYCMQALTPQVKVPIIQMALFLIKRDFIQSKIDIPIPFRDQVVTAIFEIVKNVGVKVLMNIGAEILCGIVLRTNEYQKFIQQLVEICKSPDPKIRTFALISFDFMGGCLSTEIIETYVENFLSIFTDLLNDTDLQVRIQSVRTIATFLSSIVSSDLLTKLGAVLSKLISTMIYLLTCSEDEGKAALESLITLTECQPNIWDKYLSDIVIVCSQIISTTKFKEEIRSGAIELIMIIAEEKKADIRKIAEVKTILFPALLQMMTEVSYKDDITAWTNDEEDDAVKIDAVSSASSAISRLTEVLGSKATTALTDSHIMTYIKSPDWTYRQAGILCIGLISENCKEILIKEPTTRIILESLFPFIDDEHVRVRYATTTSLALLCTELSPDIEIRSEERRVGKECTSWCRSRWAP